MSEPSDYPVMTRFDWIVEGRRAHALRGERDDLIQLHSLTYIPRVFKKLRCPDGFTVSMQGSEFNYSSPRDNLGPYNRVELGFPKRIDKRDREVLEHYVEGQWGKRLEDCIYPFVPIGVVRDMVFRHCVGRSSPGKHVILGVALVLLILLVAILA